MVQGLGLLRVQGFSSMGVCTPLIPKNLCGSLARWEWIERGLGGLAVRASGFWVLGFKVLGLRVYGL